jgi:cytochrome c-type biogenesis protein CcmF
VIPELGQFALALAICLAVCQAVLPIAGAYAGRADWMAVARPAAVGQFVFVAFAFGILAYAFLSDDFSVLYVATNSNSALPVQYKFAAIWGGHEGSMLLWILVLSVWTMAVAWASGNQPPEFRSRVIGVLGIVSVGIMLFLMLTSNPFDRLLPAAFEGNDLNPLLQDPAMVIHPPMLYVGYVGMSVPFAFAVAALLSGRFDREWARWMRPWTITAWIFLTLGIALGSWWAYYELGWGGWWFWDPVENSSFMPWLMATALIHSLAVTEKRGIFKSWTVLLAIAAFSLSLLGTFLTRSGVLISVHAFASDPERGLFILRLLGAICGGALLLYAVRARTLVADGGFKLLSREAFLLANNILLVIATIMILFGTIYPLVLDALGLGKISVGPPYFNIVFLLPMLPLALLLGIGMHAAWKRMPLEPLKQKIKWAAVAAVLVGIVAPWLFFGESSVLTTIGLTLGVWVVFSSLIDPIMKLRATGSVGLTRSHLAMLVAHLGMGLFIVGATVTSAFNIETDRAMIIGETAEVAGYEFEFRGVSDAPGPNFEATEGEFIVRRDGVRLANLYPQIRTYAVQRSPMTEAAIDFALSRDLFVALGEPLGGNAWSVRIRYKPLISLIWLGALVMAFGGLLAASDRRYAVAAKSTATKPKENRTPSAKIPASEHS